MNGTKEEKLKCARCGFIIAQIKIETTCEIIGVCDTCKSADRPPIFEGIPIISRIVVMDNDMVMVFDRHGKQIPHYQGTWDENKVDIVGDKPDHVKVEYK